MFQRLIAFSVLPLLAEQAKLADCRKAFRGRRTDGLCEGLRDGDDGRGVVQAAERGCGEHSRISRPATGCQGRAAQLRGLSIPADSVQRTIIDRRDHWRGERRRPSGAAGKKGQSLTSAAYSYRKAEIGSMREAFHAGTRAASAATAASAAAAPA